MTSTLKVVRVLEPELRQRFNTGRFWERVQAGELTAYEIDRGVPGPNKGEPPGTISQMMSYRDRDDNEVARVHQYLRPDGSLGASGRPDPKRLLDGEILYRLTKKHNREDEAKTSTPPDPAAKTLPQE